MPSPGFGIELGNVTDFHIQRCYIHSVVRDGIDVTGSSSGKGFIVDNLITDANQIYAPSATNVVTNNKTN